MPVGRKRTLASIKAKRSSWMGLTLNVTVVMFLLVRSWSPDQSFAISCTVILCHPVWPWKPLRMETAQTFWALCFTLSHCLCVLIVRIFFLISSLNVSCFNIWLSSSHYTLLGTAWLCCLDGLLLDTGRLLIGTPKSHRFFSGQSQLSQPLLTG